MESLDKYEQSRYIDHIQEFDVYALGIHFMSKRNVGIIYLINSKFGQNGQYLIKIRPCYMYRGTIIRIRI